MSSALPPSPSVRGDHLSRVGRLLGSYGAVAVRAVRAVAFWLAILLPAAVLVVASGAAGHRPALVGGLLAANVACAVVGHGHALESR